jgi:transposase
MEMLDEDTRASILKLHEKGHSLRHICKLVRVSRKSVRAVVRSGRKQAPRLKRAEKAEPHIETIRELYQQCRGNLVRVYEELTLKGVKFSYPALTAFCRRHHIVEPEQLPVGQYLFKPGEEMQHDTSPHHAHIGGALRKVQTASLALCFSRMLFFQLYPAFNRFTCKVFLSDALQYFGCTCGRCMIDNTHVVVLKGTGREMVPVPEMEAFSERLGFTFIAHEKGDANRSARVERPFHFIENNFLAGREFTDFEHANREAALWCDKVNASFKKHLHASPRDLFAVDRVAMKPLPEWVPEVYALHQRIVDTEGYVHLANHHYSVPYQLIGRRVEVRETKNRVLIFDGPRQIAEHGRVLTGQQHRSTQLEHRPPRGSGRAVERQSTPEERELAAAEPPLPEYAAELKKRSSLRWPIALRWLAQMRRDYPSVAFLEAVRTALHYGLYELERLERMVLRNLANDYFIVPADGADGSKEGPDHE